MKDSPLLSIIPSPAPPSCNPIIISNVVKVNSVDTIQQDSLYTRLVKKLFSKRRIE